MTAVLLAGESHRPRPLDACLSLTRIWKLLNSRDLFRRLALCMAIVGVVSEGIQVIVVGVVLPYAGLLLPLDRFWA